MAGHARLSPSGADTWIRCPGSVGLQRDQPNTDSEFAQEGTAAHYLAAECLKLGAIAQCFLGCSIVLLQAPDGNRYEIFDSENFDVSHTVINTFLVDADMMDAVQIYLDLVSNIAQHGMLSVEVKVPLEHITGEKDATGTADAVILCSNEIVVIDLKYGKGVPVYAEDNYQLQMYALGVLDWFDLAGLTEGINHIRLVISQPRKSASPSEWDLSIEELRSFGVRAAASARAGMNPNLQPIYNPSEKACRWCRAKAICPALENRVIGTVIDDFEVVGNDQIKVADKLSIAGIQLLKLENERLGWLMGQLELISEWVKAVRARAEAKIFAGETIMGFKLVQGKKGNSAWTSEDEAEKLLKSMKLKVDEMYNMKLITPTAAKKLLKDSPKRLDRITSLITQAEGSATVAPVSDPRPTYEIKSVANAFIDATGSDLV